MLHVAGPRYYRQSSDKIDNDNRYNSMNTYMQIVL